jgi:hypothetical protein
MPAREDLALMHVSASLDETARRCLTRLGVTVPEDAYRDLTATALMWAAYLDERSELPIPPEADFRVELYLAALHQGLASWSLPPGKADELALFVHEAFGFTAYVAPGVPLALPVATKATHEELRIVLAAEITRYDRASARRTVRRAPSVGRRARSRLNTEVG